MRLAFLNHTTQLKGMALNANHGFSLIELMVVVTIIGITAAFAAPNFASWIADSRTRSTAEAIQNGLRLAQGEAVKRGVQVQFVLTNDSPTAKDVTASTTGINWVIQTMERAEPAKTDTFVQGAMLESVSDKSLVNASAATVTFNSFGRVETPAGGVRYTLANATGGTRTLRVDVSAAGAVRMCDPDIARSTNPVGCD